MPQAVMPLSLFLLDAATSFTDIDPPPGTRALLEAFDQSGLTVSGFRFDEVEGGTRLTLMLPPLPGEAGGELVIAVPEMPWLSLVLSAAHLGERPVMEFFEPLADEAFVEVRDFRIALRLNLPLLRPADGADSVEFAYRGGLRLSRQWGVTLAEDSGLELLPVEIAGSGVVLSARGLAADFRTDHNLHGLTALGLPNEFQGLYLHHGRIELLPQIGFGSRSGLAVDFNDVAIGNLGISAKVRSHHAVVTDGQRIDAASGLAGHLLHPDWQIALAAVELDLHRNAFERFFVEGLLSVPPLQTLLRCSFGLEAVAGGGFVTRVVLRAEHPTTCRVGAAELVVDALQASGVLGSDNFSVEGSLSGRLELPEFSVEIGQARVVLQHRPDGDRFELELRQVPFGALGEVESARLVIESDLLDGERQWRLLMSTELQWADLHQRLDFGALPERFPVPPDDAHLVAELRWASAPATTLHLTLRAELTDVDALWRGVPAAWRPQLRRASLDLTVDYADAAAFGSASTSSTFSGEVSATLAIVLPPLPADAPWRDLIAIGTGNTDGEIEVKLRAGMRPDAAGDPGDMQPYLALAIADPVSLALQIPGLLQPQPPLQAALASVEIDLAGGAASEGRFAMAGRFTLNPIAPPPEVPLAGHLHRLLEGLGLGTIGGEVGATLAFDGERSALMLEGRFEGAELSIDLFDLLANLAQGMGGGEGLADSPLDLDIGFGLRGIRFQLGSLEASAAAEQVSLELVVGLRMGGIAAEVFLRLSDRELAVGLAEDFPIPLEMPVFPVAPADLAPLVDAAGHWQPVHWTAELDRLQQAADSEVERSARDALLARRFVLQGINAVFQLMGSDANRQLYQTQCTMVVGLLHGVTSALHVDTTLALVLAGRRRADGGTNPSAIQFRLPFADPRNIGVGGAAHLTGFGPEDPLRVLEGIQLGLGLSADMLYFSADSVAGPIEIPPIGRYDGGSVNLSRIRIGYGYTRNSLAIELAGAVRLPDQLVEDADTTEVIGAGVRLPTHSALNFRLDLIPVTLGAVDFVVPLVAFDLDLRNPEKLGLLDPRRCLPDWDGLQFIVDGVYRDSLRRVAFSPFFAMLPMPNLRLDGALTIGDGSNGVQVVIDDMLVLFGLWTGGGTPVPIPLLAETMAPYFRNLCVNVNFAGFGIHFNLQRPFPSFSPLVLFEMLGLISDPMMPIDRHGELARSIRITLTEGRLRVPDEVVRMFPGLADVVDKPVRAEINLGDAIGAMQAIVRAAQEASQVLEDAGRALDRRVHALRRSPPRLDPAALLALLPPQLRKFRAGGQMAGFEVGVVLLLADARDSAMLAAEFARRRAAAPAATAPAMAWGQASGGQALTQWRPNVPPDPNTQVVDHRDPSQSLLRGIEFDAFDAADLALLPAPPAGHAGILVGAHLKLFNGQRIRFLGHLFDDGSFALIAAANARPLKLVVMGIAVKLPLHLDARLLLRGRQRRGSSFGAITGQVHADWSPLPGIARLTVGTVAKPASLSLHSDGRFAVQGSVVLDLFNGGARIDGEVAIDPTQCRVSGSFEYQVAGLLEWRLQIAGGVGPGPQFSLEGDGDAMLLGYPLAAVSGRITQSSAWLSARLETARWKVAGVEVDATIALALVGEVELSRRLEPAFRFDGEGTLSLMGARIEGRGGVSRRDGRMKAYAEGVLTWRGRRWLDGRIEAGDDGVAISGRASIAIALSPSNVGGVDLAHLFLRLDIGGAFALDSDAGLARFEIDGQWLLASKLPGDAGQVFPLAMQTIAASGQAMLEIELVHIRDIVRLPFGGIDLPKPKLTASGDQVVRFGKVDGHTAASWAGKRVKLIHNLLPVVDDGHLSEDETERKVRLRSYSVGLDTENTISLALPAEGDFRLALVWHNGRLKLRVKSGDSPDWYRNL
jgi:hypothetical protein